MRFKILVDLRHLGRWTARPGRRVGVRRGFKWGKPHDHIRRVRSRVLAGARAFRGDFDGYRTLLRWEDQGPGAQTQKCQARIASHPPPLVTCAHQKRYPRLKLM